MKLCSAFLFALLVHGVLYAQEAPVLVLSRVTPKAGDEASYEAHLRRQAHLCAKLACPFRYVVLQPVMSTNEVWSLAVYASLADKQKMEDYYLNGAPAVLRMHFPVARWSGGAPTTYRSDLSHWAPWGMGEHPFLVITFTKNPALVDGVVFEGTDASRIIVSYAETRSDADAIAGAAGPDAVILAIRPDLSVPEKTWIVANPELWAKPASAKDIRPLIDAGQIPQ